LETTTDDQNLWFQSALLAIGQKKQETKPSFVCTYDQADVANVREIVDIEEPWWLIEQEFPNYKN
jgi:hypothetical protein